MLKLRLFCRDLRRFLYFLQAAFSRRGLFHPEGRRQIRGKLRRWAQSLVPAYAHQLQRQHGLAGGCVGCGVSCRLLFRCPDLDPLTRRCTIYEHRPNVCRLFPITPQDLADRDRATIALPCGFRFIEGDRARAA